MFRWEDRTSHLCRMKNSSYYIAPVGDRTHDLPHTVASNMVKCPTPHGGGFGCRYKLSLRNALLYFRNMSLKNVNYDIVLLNRKFAHSIFDVYVRNNNHIICGCICSGQWNNKKRGRCKRSAFSDCIRFPYFPCLLSFDVKAVGQEQLSSGCRQMYKYVIYFVLIKVFV